MWILDGSEECLPALADWRQAYEDEKRHYEEMTMGLHRKAGGGGADFEPAPAGLHQAVCVGVLSIGTQPSGQYEPKQKVCLRWEIEPRMNDGRRFLVQSMYTFSLHEKASLRRMLEGWRGKKYREGEDVNLEAVVGKPATLHIVHAEVGDRTFANIQAVMPAQDGGLKPEGDLLVFDIENPDMDVLDRLSERMQEKIKAAPEYGAGGSYKPTFAGAAAGQAEPVPQPPKGEPAQPMKADFDDDIPF